METIEALALDDNLLSGDVSTLFNDMPLLKGLYLEDNNFYGRIDSNFLRNNKLLRYADLSSNQFTGYVPAHFFDHTVAPYLWVLDFHNNRLSSVLPSNISAESDVRFLSLHGNWIEGNVPASWVNLKSLVHLDLSSNLFEGPIPDHVGNMTELAYLFMANNSFAPGPIPESFAQLTNMEEFSLKNTNRSGVLPIWLTEWENLELLDLDQNNFVGQIPAAYGNMTKLQFLLLNRNNIDGQLPASFSQMTNLRAVFLEKNGMTGRLDVLCGLPNFNEPENDIDGTEIIAADCAGGETAQIVCTCCKICCVPEFNQIEEGFGIEDTCHDATAIAHLNPYWERSYIRWDFDFGNDTRFVNRDWMG